MSSAFRIALLYLTLGLAWIYFTRTITFHWSLDYEALKHLHHYQSELIVLVTALGLYFLVRKSTQAYRVRAREFELLFEQHPHPMFVLDASGLRILAVNQAALEQYGYSRAEFLALSSLDLRPQEDRQRYLQEVQKLQGHRYRGGNWRHINKNGEIMHVKIYRNPVVFQGEQAGLVMSVIVTDQEQALGKPGGDMQTPDAVPATSLPFPAGKINYYNS